jgi:cellulose biosynthesis protein BcsQ
MTRGTPTVAVAGATGGAGTTRLAVEVAATLARDDESVAVLDAAFATQGLARYVPGRIDPDLTKRLVEEGALGDACYDLPLDVSGRVVCSPAYAPFERLARAKTPGAAQRFETFLADAASEFDHVLVDVPPVAANQSVAAVTAADRVALVAPATHRGANAVGLARDRLRDLGTREDLVVANRAGSDHPVSSADVAIPGGPRISREAAPTVTDPDEEFAPAVARLAEEATSTSLDLEFEGDGLLERVEDRIHETIS